MLAARLLALPGLALVLALVPGAGHANGGESKMLAGGLYQVSLGALPAAVPLNVMHRWRLSIARPGGNPVTGARIQTSGGTIDHEHGLPTAPRVSGHLGGGRYLIDGVKFDRQGNWRLDFEIRAGAGSDRVSFAISVGTAVWAELDDAWTEDERAVLRSLWIGSLPEPPPDLSNMVADNEAAAAFGHRLFFDPRLSKNGLVACATCYIPELAFTDGRKRARGLGNTARNTPTIIGAAYSPWQFWDGRKDSLWSQALGPFENAKEHASSRDWVVGVVRRDLDYRRRYRALFGPVPEPADTKGIDRAFANLGKSIAAYERAILPAPNPA